MSAGDEGPDRIPTPWDMSQFEGTINSFTGFTVDIRSMHIPRGLPPECDLSAVIVVIDERRSVKVRYTGEVEIVGEA